ncbi:MAG: S41 family peptidase [Paludibacteraceae bacterium]|nr:S41 family peptidase [Paludibacteraceae bacterium]
MRKYLFFIIAATLCSLSVSAEKNTTRIDRTLSIYTDVMRQLDINYCDTLNYDDILETAINQTLRKVDPYTVYYPKKKDDDLRMLTTGKYGGIGAIIQLREVEKAKGQTEKQIIIANPYEGKPAQRNDVLSGDIILSVDGVSAKDKEVSEVSNLLRGEPGTIVKLNLERNGEKISREFAREDIHMAPVDYYSVFRSQKSKVSNPVGYIGFSEFTEGSAAEFKEALDELVAKEHIEGVIIDLRGNGGGIIDEAIRIVENFVPKGTMVVSTKGKVAVSNRIYTTSSEPAYPDLPIVIMVDKNSASAAEIVSGGLQDLQRATIVGQRTFGKGLVQNVRPIAYGGHLKVTTSKYYLPSGRCIQAIDYAEMHKGNKVKKDTAGGILPDIEINDSAKVDVTYALYTKHMFFDYSVQYRRLHDSVAQPEVYEVSDADIEDFCRFLEEKEFTYETETSKYFKDMMEMAKVEDIDSATLAQLEAIAPQLKPSFQVAIQRNKEEVKEMLGAEIMERYYFQKGRIAYLLRFDKELKRALEVF